MQISDELVHAVIIACGWEERDDAESEARTAVENEAIMALVGEP